MPMKLTMMLLNVYKVKHFVYFYLSLGILKSCVRYELIII